MLNEEEWLNILSYTGKFVRESRSKFTQYEIIHRYYWIPARLHRTGLSNNNLCWKCQEEKGHFSHCIWDCSLVQPFWKKILRCMSEWLGRTLPISPRLCLLGDKSQVHNISKLSVVMIGLTTAARTVLTYWKSAKPQEMKEWVNYMIKKTASYKSTLIRRNDGNHTKGPTWGLFGIMYLWLKTWTHNCGPVYLSLNVTVFIYSLVFCFSFYYLHILQVIIFTTIVVVALVFVCLFLFLFCFSPRTIINILAYLIISLLNNFWSVSYYNMTKTIV